MGLYLGNKKVKFNLNGKYYKLNILSSPVIKGIKLKSSDGFYLKSSDGLILFAKDGE